MSGYQFRWDVVVANLPFLVPGIGLTLLISVVTLLISSVLGMLLALMSMSRIGGVRMVASIFGEIIRNTPILVQLLWVYYVLPIVFDVGIEAFTAAIIGLSVYSSAFIAEVYRAGIQTVPNGQREAAQVLGLNAFQTFGGIVLPQAMKAILPPLASNFVQLIKYSSLASVLSVGEITHRGSELASSTFRPLEIYTFVAVVYFFICWPLSLSIKLWERRLGQR